MSTKSSKISDGLNEKLIKENNKEEIILPQKITEISNKQNSTTNSKGSFKKSFQQTKEENILSEEELLQQCGGIIKTSYMKANICSKIFFCWSTKLIPVKIIYF